MAKSTVLKLIIHLMVFPLSFLSAFLTFLRRGTFYRDLCCCLQAVDTAPFIPHRFVATLIVAEDHRNNLHPGVDPIAILRAIFVFVKTGRLQGASTIEQQFVRVVLHCYERTFKRKFREQLLAIALTKYRKKEEIAMSYLAIAYYGSGKYGISALRSEIKNELSFAEQQQISYLIAKLKYPEPSIKTVVWAEKVEKRVNYISQCLVKFSG